MKSLVFALAASLGLGASASACDCHAVAAVNSAVVVQSAVVTPFVVQPQVVAASVVVPTFQAVVHPAVVVVQKVRRRDCDRVEVLRIRGREVVRERRVERRR